MSKGGEVIDGGVDCLAVELEAVEKGRRNDCGPKQKTFQMVEASSRMEWEEVPLRNKGVVKEGNSIEWLKLWER